MKRRKRIALVFTIIWIVALILSGLIRDGTSHDIPVFIGLAVLALIPLFFGTVGYRIFGIVAVAFSLIAIYSFNNSSLRHRVEMEDAKPKKETATNGLSPDSINR